VNRAPAAPSLPSPPATGAGHAALLDGLRILGAAHPLLRLLLAALEALLGRAAIRPRRGAVPPRHPTNRAAPLASAPNGMPRQPATPCIGALVCDRCGPARTRRASPPRPVPMRAARDAARRPAPHPVPFRPPRSTSAPTGGIAQIRARPRTP
jgi:hypothetical protein